MSAPTPDEGGLLLVDKPIGPTSFDVVQRVKRALQFKRAGHAGTLDPNATGLLLVAVGEATRLLSFLTADEKSYRGTVRFGVTTDTLDAAGTVLAERDASHLQRADVAAAVEALEGVTSQVAPMFSAKRVDGRRLHELAREGTTIERAPFPVTIHAARLESWEPPDAVIHVRCSKGTYIRTLAETLGEQLGTGAHLAALRRLTSGPFSIANAIALTMLEERGLHARERLLSTESALESLPAIRLDERTTAGVCFGNPVEVDQLRRLEQQAPGAGALVRLLSPDGAVVAVGVVQPSGQISLARVLKARTGPGLHRRDERSQAAVALPADGDSEAPQIRR